MSELWASSPGRCAAYLDALGISRWELRIQPAATVPRSPAVAPAPAVVATAAAVPLPQVSMSGARRAAYLKAMDITCWLPRVPVVPLARVQLESETVIEPDVMTETLFDVAPELPPAALAPEVLAPVNAEPLRLEMPLPAVAPAWDVLREQVANCRACELCATRTQTVFGAGARDAQLMLIGEAPGADEDRLGEPFVGRAGKLLTSMVTALGLTREQVYIANVLKCRPPDNRNPKPEEAAQCAGFLNQQIALVQPRVIVALGAIAAQHLLHTSETIGKLRGQWWQLEPAGIPLRATYHPAYLLRSPEQKAKSWEDLTAVLERLAVS
ncbi:uracil-DNA glycosylase [Chromatium okenii]|uniref:uracil-DNA glycosylase n=1 Tax=Chromatium okenii TaxID=61644 RepID=UPI001F5B8B30|nr:uracil-DNA glycosylase [Chromatium okenii]